MTKTFYFAALLALSLGAALFTNTGQSSASFHHMRVDAAMAGYYGNPNVQYVELRMADAAENFVSSAELCFFDSLGVPYARYKFPTDVGNGADGSSILIGTTEFAAAWPAGTPDFTFTAPDASAIASGANATHPLRAPGGKIGYGTDGVSAPFCAGNFFVLDSVAYGAGSDYTGSVDYGTKFVSDMPTNSSNGMHLIGPVCTEGDGYVTAHPCAVPRDNSMDYGIADLNAGSNQPRNNAGLQGPLTSDIDSDGVLNASYNCPFWPNPTQALPAWPVPAGDTDCDGFPDSVAVPQRASEAFLGTDPSFHCAADNTLNNEGLPDRWPVDFNDDQLVSGGDFLAFAPVYGRIAPDPLYNANVRFNLNGDDRISGGDFLVFGPYYGKKCA